MWQDHKVFLIPIPYKFHDIPQVKAQKGTRDFLKTGTYFVVTLLAVNEIYKGLGLRKPYDLATFIPFLGSAKFGAPPHVKITKGIFDILTSKRDTAYQRKNLPKDFLFYILFPFGGGTAKKLIPAIKGESRTAPTKTKPRGKRRFRIEGADVIRAIIGGEWQTNAGQEYLKKKGMIDEYNKLWYILTGKKTK